MNTAVRLLITAGVLLLLAGCIFAFMKLWFYAVLLGILAIAVSVFCNAAGVLVEGVISGFTDIENKVDFNIYSNIALGVVFIIVSLLCRCGAELRQTGVTTK